MCRGEACLARHRGMMLSRDPEVLFVITDVVHWSAISRYTENHINDSVTCTYADLFVWTGIC